MRSFRVEALCHRPVAQHGVEIAHRAAHWRAFCPIPLFTKRLEAGDDNIDLGVLVDEFGAASVGYGKSLARTIAGFFGNQAFVDQQIERGIDDAGAGRVFPAGQITYRADQVIAVSRLLRDEVKQEQAQFATGKHTTAATPATASTATASATETAAKWTIFTEWSALAEGTAKTATHHRHHFHGVATAPMAAPAK